MAFVKLDTGILNSTIWLDRPGREVFLTALLLAEPRVYDAPVEQLKVGSLEGTGWSAPPGWYGYVPASGPGIISRSGVGNREGEEALERLGMPEPESRSQEHDGRRMIRIDGGYLILNYQAYREKDHGSAERSRRYRERLKERGLIRSKPERATIEFVTVAPRDSLTNVEMGPDGQLKKGF
jgi:hypothetical protein